MTPRIDSDLEESTSEIFQDTVTDIDTSMADQSKDTIESDPDYEMWLKLQKKFGTEVDIGTERKESEEDEQEKKKEEQEEKEMLMLARVMKKLTYNKIPTPCFKGEKGLDPSTHLLRVSDWFEAEMTSQAEKTRQFKLTLEGKARQWYDDITVPAEYDVLTKMFLRQFSMVGRSQKQLHEKWRTLSFDPSTDEAETFIRDVKQTAKQMGYGEDAVLNCLKSCMPDHVAIALYNVDNLSTAIEMIQDIFSKTGQKSSKAPDLFTAQTTPITATSGEQQSQPSVQFASTDLLGHQISKFTAAAEQLSDQFSKQGPYKPQINPRGRFRGRGRNQSRGRGRYNSGYRQRSNSRNGYQNNGYQNNGYQNNSYRGRGRSQYNNNRSQYRDNRYRSPSRSQSSQRDDGRCFKCHQFGHWARDCRNTQNTTQHNHNTQNQNSQSTQNRDSRPRTRGNGNQNRFNTMEPHNDSTPQASSQYEYDDDGQFDLNY